MDEEFKTPRFVLAVFFSLTTTSAYFFTDKMNTDQYIYAMGVILGLYGAIAITKAMRQKGKSNV